MNPAYGRPIISYCRDGGTTVSSCVATARRLLRSAMEGIERQELAMRALSGVSRAQKAPPPNQGKRWLAEHDAYLIRERNAGASLSAIAAHLGRTEHTVKVRCAVLSESARKSGGNSPFKPKNKAWSEDEKTTAAKMMADGKRAEDIAKAMGRKAGSVESMMKRLRQGGFILPA